MEDMLRYDIHIEIKSKDFISGYVTLHSFKEQREVGSFLFEQSGGKTSFRPKVPDKYIPEISDRFTQYLHTWISGYNKEWNFFFWDK
jgi:hypothetical protein